MVGSKIFLSSLRPDYLTDPRSGILFPKPPCLAFSRATRTCTCENSCPCPGVLGFRRVRVGVLKKPTGAPTHGRVCLRNQPRNLTTAVLASTDTAVQHCEVSNSVAGGSREGMVPARWRVGCTPPRSWAKRGSEETACGGTPPLLFSMSFTRQGGG